MIFVGADAAGRFLATELVTAGERVLLSNMDSEACLRAGNYHTDEMLSDLKDHLIIEINFCKLTARRIKVV